MCSRMAPSKLEEKFVTLTPRDAPKFLQKFFQRTNRAVYALVPRSKVRHVGTVNNDDPVLALRRSEAECGWEGGHALFLPYATACNWSAGRPSTTTEYQ